MNKEVIKIKKLTKYYGNQIGVKDLDLTIREGEFFGFIGPNGAGKSTTIRTMLNFLFPTSGTVEIFNMDATKESEKIKQFIGYVPSEVGYYDYMTVLDLLKYSATFDGESIDTINDLAKYFELDLNKKINTLSFGNKKKVAIVNALLGNPKLLILDEPANGLDPLMQKKLFAMLKEKQKEGVTIFLSSHNLGEVEKYCDRVAIIKDGSLISVDKVTKINNKKLKHISIKPSKGIKLNTKGIKNLEEKEGVLHFDFDGNINELIKEINKYEIEELIIMPTTLEEDFLKYYES